MSRLVKANVNKTSESNVELVQLLGTSGNVLSVLADGESVVNSDGDIVAKLFGLAGRDENDKVRFIKVNSFGAIELSLTSTAFGELLVGQLHPQIQQSFEYTVDNTDLNDNITVRGGTVTQADGMAVLSTSTTINSLAFLESKHHVRYRGGLGGHGRITALFTPGVAGTEQYIALADDLGSDAAKGSVILTGGGSGSIDGITIDSIEIMSGAETFDTDLIITARKVVANINANTSSPNYSATSEGVTITIKSYIRGTGPNGFVVASSTTTITTTDANLLGGTDGAAFKNGYGIGFDGVNFGIHRWRNNEKFTINLEDCDDPLGVDGVKGKSGMTYIAENLNVFGIQYQYLGSGAIRYNIESDKTGRLFPFHSVLYTNTDTQPSTHNPNFHFIMYVNNKNTTSNLIIKSGSYGYFTEGKTSHIEIHQPQNSSGLKEKTSVTAEAAIFSIRVRGTYFSKKNYIDILLENFLGQIEASNANNLGSVRIVLNAALGGIPSWSNINTNNSVVEIDTSGTTVTGGKEVAVIPLAGKNDKDNLDLTPFKIILKHGDMITVAGLSDSSATIDSNLLWRELF